MLGGREKLFTDCNIDDTKEDIYDSNKNFKQEQKILHHKAIFWENLLWNPVLK